MKIVIVGSGICGLSLYLALKKHLSPLIVENRSPSDDPSLEIKIFESHAAPTKFRTSTIGGGLGLGPNGLRAIMAISPSAGAAVQNNSFNCSQMTFRNSTGTLVGRMVFGTKKRYGVEYAFASRQCIHEALLSEIPPHTIVWNKKVIRLQENEEGVRIDFDDFTSEYADLVIGADGVRSVAREAVLGQGYEAQYNGFTGIGGFIPISELPTQLTRSLSKDPVTMTFGARGMFGYAPSTSLSAVSASLMWWSTYETAEPPPPDVLLSDIQSQLSERHASWKSPADEGKESRVFPTLVTLACGSQSEAAQATATERDVLILPVYTTPRLARWCSPTGKIVLMGDAAHTMPPDAGQGVSCAVEDAVAFSRLLGHYWNGHGDSELANILKATAKGYESVRMTRVNRILDDGERKALGKKNVKWWQEWIRDWMLWIICKLPESLNDHLLGHDVGKEVDKYIALNGKQNS